MNSFRYPTAQSLIAEALESTGLRDFGPGNFEEGLNRFLAALQEEIDLNEASTSQYVATVRRRLTNRLEIEEWCRTHPEVLAAPIGPSVSITGLPRSGTTALVNVMSLDDQFRPLRGWEQAKPCPPPVPEEEADDPRRQAAMAVQDTIMRTRPDLVAMHLWDATASEEDVEVMGLTFKAQQSALPIFKYQAWWRDTDMTDAYIYHRRAIKLLQSRRPPNQWLFKSPAHSFHLEPLLKAYPELRIIMTHRDPAKVVPSVISLLTAYHPPELKVDLRDFGRKQCEHLRIGMENAIAARKRLGNDRFIDVHHREFVADPMGSLDRIYKFLNLKITPRTRAKMTEWHAKNRSGVHGTHSYTAEQYGLTKDQIRSDFDFYIKHFGLQIEG